MIGPVCVSVVGGQAGWDDWTDQPTVPPFLLPTRSVAVGSCTACTTILLNAPVVCAGAWYKSKDTLVSQAFKVRAPCPPHPCCSALTGWLRAVLLSFFFSVCVSVV